MFSSVRPRSHLGLAVNFTYYNTFRVSVLLYSCHCFYLSQAMNRLMLKIGEDTALAEVQELVQTGEVDVKETDCDGNNILHKVCSLKHRKVRYCRVFDQCRGCSESG